MTEGTGGVGSKIAFFEQMTGANKAQDAKQTDAKSNTGSSEPSTQTSTPSTGRTISTDAKGKGMGAGKTDSCVKQSGTFEQNVSSQTLGGSDRKFEAKLLIPADSAKKDPAGGAEKTADSKTPPQETAAKTASVVQKFTLKPGQRRILTIPSRPPPLPPTQSEGAAKQRPTLQRQEARIFSNQDLSGIKKNLGQVKADSADGGANVEDLAGESEVDSKVKATPNDEKKLKQLGTLVDKLAAGGDKKKLKFSKGEFKLVSSKLGTESAKGKSKETIKSVDKFLDDISELQSKGLDTTEIMVKACKNKTFYSALKANPELRGKFNQAVIKPFLDISKADLKSEISKNESLKYDLKSASNNQERSDIQSLINTTSGSIKNRNAFHEFLSSKADSTYFASMFHDNPVSYGDTVSDHIRGATGAFESTVGSAQKSIPDFENKARNLLEKLPVDIEQKSTLEESIEEISKEAKNDIKTYTERKPALYLSGLFTSFKNELNKNHNKDVEPRDITINEGTLPTAINMISGVGGSAKKLSDSLIPSFIDNVHKNVYLKQPILQGLKLKPPAGGSITEADQQVNLNKLKDNLRKANIEEDKIDELANEINNLVNELASNFLSKGTNAKQWFGNMENLFILLKENNIVQ